MMPVYNFFPNVIKPLFDWLVKTKYANRNEDSLLVGKIEEKIGKIVSSSIAYWSQDNVPMDVELKNLRTEIVSSFGVLSLSLQTLRSRLNDFDYESIFLQLKKITTGGEFENISRKADNDIINTINKNASSLNSAVQTAYNKKYRK